MFSKVASFLLFIIAYSHAQDCNDEVSFCKTIDRHGLCDTNVAQRRCRKTCNNCTVPVPEKNTPGPGCRDTSEECEDTFYNCGVDADYGDQCEQTCEICACHDVVHFCAWIVKDSLCGMEAAKRNCRATCKHCAVAVPEIKESTETCKDDREDCEENFRICAISRTPRYVPKCRKTCEICGNETIIPTTLAPEISTGSQVTSEVITESPEVTSEVITVSPNVTSEVITESPEVTPEVSTESTEVTSEVITESPEVTPEVSTESTEVTSEVITESPEVTPEVSTESTEVTSEVITESPEVPPEVSTESPELTSEIITESPEVTSEIITEPPVVTTESLEVTPDVTAESPGMSVLVISEPPGPTESPEVNVEEAEATPEIAGSNEQ